MTRGPTQLSPACSVQDWVSKADPTDEGPSRVGCALLMTFDGTCERGGGPTSTPGDLGETRCTQQQAALGGPSFAPSSKRDTVPGYRGGSIHLEFGKCKGKKGKRQKAIEIERGDLRRRQQRRACCAAGRRGVLSITSTRTTPPPPPGPPLEHLLDLLRDKQFLHPSAARSALPPSTPQRCCLCARPYRQALTFANSALGSNQRPPPFSKCTALIAGCHQQSGGCLLPFLRLRVPRASRCYRQKAALFFPVRNRQIPSRYTKE
jgi:hypothetical protein